VKAVEEQLSWKTSVVVLVWRTVSTGGCAIFTVTRIPILRHGLLLEYWGAIPTVFGNEKI
jgi:hypothetical protein